LTHKYPTVYEALKRAYYTECIEDGKFYPVHLALDLDIMFPQLPWCPDKECPYLRADNTTWMLFYTYAIGKISEWFWHFHSVSINDLPSAKDFINTPVDKLLELISAANPYKCARVYGYTKNIESAFVYDQSTFIENMKDFLLTKAERKLIKKNKNILQ
jgi:hypothetical protein